MMNVTSEKMVHLFSDWSVGKCFLSFHIQVFQNN